MMASFRDAALLPNRVEAESFSFRETRGRILGHNWDKILESFLLAIHSHIY
jgi:hypothetical protein